MLGWVGFELGWGEYGTGLYPVKVGDAQVGAQGGHAVTGQGASYMGRRATVRLVSAAMPR